MAKTTLKKQTLPSRRIEVFRDKTKVKSEVNNWNWRRMYKSEVLSIGTGYDSKDIAKKMANIRSKELKRPVPVFVV